MNTVITICAKNYIGLSLILGQSVEKYNKDCRFLIFVADEMSQEDKIRLSVPDNVVFAREVLPLADSIWDEMAFKYNLTEFCTAIKPFCLEWVFNNTSTDKVIYFDPDVLIYDSLDIIWNILDKSSFLITPHILTIETEFTGQIKEEGILFSGMYNLGFIGLKKTIHVRQMLDWWKNRLTYKCYSDNLNFYFFDQKWIDFLPCFFPEEEVYICRNMGFNVAPWNYYERKLINIDGKYFATSRISKDSKLDPLIFVHYSGYNYKSLLNNRIEQKNIENLKKYPDIEDIMIEYHDYLQLNKQYFLHYIGLPYSYSCFDNGEHITSYHRRLLKGLLDRKEIVSRPFDTYRGSFYDRLKKNRLMPNGSNIDPETVRRGVVSKQFGKQLYVLNFLSRLLLRIIGVEKYMQILRAMRFYSRYEVQIHLLDTKYMKDNLY